MNESGRRDNQSSASLCAKVRAGSAGRSLSEASRSVDISGGGSIRGALALALALVGKYVSSHRCCRCLSKTSGDVGGNSLRVSWLSPEVFCGGSVYSEA